MEGMSGVYWPMKRNAPTLLTATLRTTGMVVLAVVLILVLVPAVLAAQAATLH
jgi:hypothetical protein